jgi:hypothetical protein
MTTVRIKITMGPSTMMRKWKLLFVRGPDLYRDGIFKIVPRWERIN